MELALAQLQHNGKMSSPLNQTFVICHIAIPMTLMAFQHIEAACGIIVYLWSLVYKLTAFVI